MPTGYTARLMEKGQTFPAFVMTCARAFGACIDMREDDMSTPIPEKFKPSLYHTEALEEAKNKLCQLESMDAAEAFEFGKLRKLEAINSSKEWLAKQQLENERLLDMKFRVETWTAPTSEHEGVKLFMLEQITASLNRTDYAEESIRIDESKSALEVYNEVVESVKS